MAKHSSTDEGPRCNRNESCDRRQEMTVIVLMSIVTWIQHIALSSSDDSEPTPIDELMEIKEIMMP